MGSEFSLAEIDELVESYIVELGLAKCADGLIGGELLKGISGGTQPLVGCFGLCLFTFDRIPHHSSIRTVTGEKRRTSLGVALVTNPSTIFLDEPTSGLDSVAARTVLQLLDKVAKAGNTVLFTIHQPSSRVFSAFDNVILINSGRLMHMSATSLIPTDFEERGFPIPANTNPADWILVRPNVKATIA
jgi:ABC-type glutathione transport system ATPase component